jgi:hypothetical protein
MAVANYRLLTFTLSLRITEKQLFKNLIATDGFTVDLHFARKKKDKSNVELSLEDFTQEEVDEMYRPCAVDPGVSTLIAASYGCGDQPHEYRTFHNGEYYAFHGCTRRNNRLNEQKTRDGIKGIESSFPSTKTADSRLYEAYIEYFFMHKDRLFEFYGPESGEQRFYNYQGGQKAAQEAANILITGGRKYNKKKRKNTRKNRKKRKASRVNKKTNTKKNAENNE